MLQSGITFELLVNGRPIAEYRKDGNTFVEGRKGSKYSLRVYNNTYQRVRLVLSVDGQNVIDGEQADYNGPAYILRPYQKIDIDGWRISNDQVKEFVFADARASRSEKMGEGTDNCGVIAVAVFNEKPMYQTWYSSPLGSGQWTLDAMGNGTCIRSTKTWSGTSETFSASAIGGSSEAVIMNMSCSAAPVNSLGTAMGETKDSKVVDTTFDSEPTPFATLTMYYYPRRELEKMGIIAKAVPAKMPEAFPRQFCKIV